MLIGRDFIFIQYERGQRRDFHDRSVSAGQRRLQLLVLTLLTHRTVHTLAATTGTSTNEPVAISPEDFAGYSDSGYRKKNAVFQQKLDLLDNSYEAQRRQNIGVCDLIAATQ